eukprot:COSAG05_NODE_1077_length_5955_cov_2.032787_2_plen_118_part_00
MQGAGGYLQNYINGYMGLRYTREGLNLRPVLPPHGVTSLTLRGLSLAGSRVDAYLYADGGAFAVTLTAGPALTVKTQGAPDKKLLLGGEPVTIKLCKSCGCGCPGGGCGCLSIVPSK